MPFKALIVSTLSVTTTSVRGPIAYPRTLTRFYWLAKGGVGALVTRFIGYSHPEPIAQPPIHFRWRHDGHASLSEPRGAREREAKHSSIHHAVDNRQICAISILRCHALGKERSNYWALHFFVFCLLFFIFPKATPVKVDELVQCYAQVCIVTKQNNPWQLL